MEIFSRRTQTRDVLSDKIILMHSSCEILGRFIEFRRRGAMFGWSLLMFSRILHQFKQVCFDLLSTDIVVWK
jgi:hypothetical protein